MEHTKTTISSYIIHYMNRLPSQFSQEKQGLMSLITIIQFDFDLCIKCLFTMLNCKTPKVMSLNSFNCQTNTCTTQNTKIFNVLEYKTQKNLHVGEAVTSKE